MTADVDAIEARLRHVEDVLAIQQLFVDYGHHLDAGDFAAYASLFARDGEIALGPIGSARGPAEIEALLSRTLADRVGTTFHLITSPVVAVDGDTATAEVMWTVVERGDDDRPVVAMLGRHRDQLVREDGQWRFARRAGHIDVPATYGR